MTKFIKILAISFILFIISINCNLYISNATEDEVDEEESTSVVQETPSSPMSTLSTSTVTSVTSLSSYDEANLKLNNILNILLISIGIVLILFAIAILIRLKR